ncbi:MAG TPA: thiamine pyrophosphate-binding protein [Woeseiaceae bacterium]|nr:thiamine pyrophosphate-binding protein [Woeseiaceae bacterium]
MKTVAQVLVESLKEIGVKHIFGVPSGGWVDYLEAIRQTDGIDFVLTSHEGGASFMADVCGRLTGVPGVCFGTFGPGATNLSTGVGGALLDRSPMLALTDEMPARLRGRTVQMGIDHQALFAPITKASTRLRAEDVRKTIFDAAAVALSSRPGPVHIGLPVGMSAMEAVDEFRDLPSASVAANPDETLLTGVVELLKSSNRPILAIGLGAKLARIDDAVLAFVEKLNIPVVLTPMAKGIVPENHRCYAGVLFHALSDQVGQIHKEADLVVSIGYDPIEFNYESWLPDAPLVHIDNFPADIDPEQVSLAAEVIGDLAKSIAFLQSRVVVSSAWDMDKLRAHREILFEKLTPHSTTLGPCATLDVLREVLPDDGIMTCDVGAHTHLIGQKWRTPGNGLQIMSNGWSSMGFGIPSAIAAKLCHPEKAVCCVVGDGGFLMTCGEIATAVREELNVVIILLTDNDLALIRIKQEKKHNPIYGTPIRKHGTVGGDNFFGAPVIRVDDVESLEVALVGAFQMKGPVIVEALVDSREYDALVLKKDKT